MVLVVDMASVIILLDNVLAILGIKVLIVLVRFQIFYCKYYLLAKIQFFAVSQIPLYIFAAIFNHSDFLSFAELTCPSDCNNAGICDTSTGQCSCDIGRHGADCSSNVPLNIFL